MGKYEGSHRAPGESSTEVVQCAWVGPAHVRRNGTADVQLGVEDGYLNDDEPGIVILQLTDDQRRALLGRLKEPA